MYVVVENKIVTYVDRIFIYCRFVYRFLLIQVHEN